MSFENAEHNPYPRPFAEALLLAERFYQKNEMVFSKAEDGTFIASPRGLICCAGRGSSEAAARQDALETLATALQNCEEDELLQPPSEDYREGQLEEELHLIAEQMRADRRDSEPSES